jgi:hypothetical protein
VRIGRRSHTSRNWDGIGFFGLLILALLFATVAPGFLSNTFIATPREAGSAAAAQQRWGFIIIPRGTACRFIQFDNTTGDLSEVDPGDCPVDPPAITISRMNAIHEAFSKK